LLIGQFPRPDHQLEGDLFGIRPLIHALPMQHMPNYYQQLTRERHNRLLFANPARQALKLTLPIRVGAGCCLCRLDVSPTGSSQ
jgi:hypothetical protein